MKYLVLNYNNEIVLRNLDTYEEACTNLNKYLESKGLRAIDCLDSFKVVTTREYSDIQTASKYLRDFRELDNVKREDRWE